MELTENKKEKGIWKLPKNVRQIGEPGSSTRILIEDYAYTYLHQMAEQNLTCMKTAVLLGNAEDGRICIQAAVEADMGQDQKKWFTNEQWRDVFAEVQQWFSGLEVVGWFLSNPGFPVQLTEELRTLHEKHFPSDKHVLFLMDVMENDADFFIKSDVGLTAAPGYYIYYENIKYKHSIYDTRMRGVLLLQNGMSRHLRKSSPIRTGFRRKIFGS